MNWMQDTNNTNNSSSSNIGSSSSSCRKWINKINNMAAFHYHHVSMGIIVREKTLCQSQRDTVAVVEKESNDCFCEKSVNMWVHLIHETRKRRVYIWTQLIWVVCVNSKNELRKKKFLKILFDLIDKIS